MIWLSLVFDLTPFIKYIADSYSLRMNI